MVKLVNNLLWSYFLKFNQDFRNCRIWCERRNTLCPSPAVSASRGPELSRSQPLPSSARLPSCRAEAQLSWKRRFKPTAQMWAGMKYAQQAGLSSGQSLRKPRELGEQTRGALLYVGQGCFGLWPQTLGSSGWPRTRAVASPAVLSGFPCRLRSTAAASVAHTGSPFVVLPHRENSSSSFAKSPPSSNACFSLPERWTTAVSLRLIS